MKIPKTLIDISTSLFLGIITPIALIWGFVFLDGGKDVTLWLFVGTVATQVIFSSFFLDYKIYTRLKRIGIIALFYFGVIIGIALLGGETSFYGLQDELISIKGDAKIVEQLILVASPQLGTAKAIPAMLHGYEENVPSNLGFFVNQSKARDFAAGVKKLVSVL